jgi:hypothetical protein
MVQIDAYKLLMVSEQTILTMVKDVPDDAWFTPLPGMDVSFDWILGHYAAVEDWFLHHLNGVPYELPPEWQKTYWADTSGPVSSETGVGRAGVIAGFTETRQRLLTALKFDLFHINRFVKKGYFPANVKFRGDAWLFVSAHAYWHIGELNCLRRIAGLKYSGTKGINH